MKLFPGATDLFAVLVHGLARRHFAQSDLVAGRDRLGSLDQPPLELQLGPRWDVDPRYGDVVAGMQVNPRIGGQLGGVEIDQLRRHARLLAGLGQDRAGFQEPIGF